MTMPTTMRRETTTGSNATTTGLATALFRSTTRRIRNGALACVREQGAVQLRRQWIDDVDPDADVDVDVDVDVDEIALNFLNLSFSKFTTVRSTTMGGGNFEN